MPRVGVVPLWRPLCLVGVEQRSMDVTEYERARLQLEGLDVHCDEVGSDADDPGGDHGVEGVVVHF